MTTLLQHAFDQAARLPSDEQDLLAVQLLAQLDDEDEFDRKIEATASKLVGLANAALAERSAGSTLPVELGSS